MSTKQARLHRLEELERQRALRTRAVRIAREHGVDAEEALLQLEAIGKRIERWGADAEVRRMAQEYGETEEQVRAELAAEVDKIRREQEEQP